MDWGEGKRENATVSMVNRWTGGGGGKRENATVRRVNRGTVGGGEEGECHNEQDKPSD